MSLLSVRARMTEAASRAGRRLEDVRLVIVSKSREAAEIGALYAAGHRDFGENRAQELGVKSIVLPEDVRWHFVGSLQTNKVRSVRPAVVMLHSVDRVELGEAWMKGIGLPPPVLVEVNVGEEPAKHGVVPAEAAALVDRLRRLGVPVVGLMTIPPHGDSPEQGRRWFALLRSLRDEIARDHPEVVELSMGMSEDLEVAIEEGATIIRVGRAIFDPNFHRDPSHRGNS